LPISTEKKNSIYYGYVIAASAAVLQIIMWTLVSTYGVFFIPIQNEFGWSRAVISGARSLSMLAWGTASIVWGYLNDRYGPRVIISVCGCIVGLGSFLMSQ